MVLNNEEQETLNALASNDKNLAIIAKFFIRPFESMPADYQKVPNTSLGEIVKSQLTAQSLNAKYFNELKMAVTVKTGESTPIAPE